jgi:hypothetical protein
MITKKKLISQAPISHYCANGTSKLVFSRFFSSTRFNPSTPKNLLMNFLFLDFFNPPSISSQWLAKQKKEETEEKKVSGPKTVDAYNSLDFCKQFQELYRKVHGVGYHINNFASASTAMKKVIDAKGHIGNGEYQGFCRLCPPKGGFKKKRR